MRRIGLVVPSLNKGGGVPAVARFLKDVVRRSDKFDLKLVSLSVASDDPASRCLRRPSSWVHGPQLLSGEWQGMPYQHVGANWSEFEFQRYKPRRILRELLSDCDLVQVVCGCPAWANTVLDVGKPISLQVATRVLVERRQRDKDARGLKAIWGKSMTKVIDRLDDRALGLVDAIQVENPWMLGYASKLNAGRSADVRYAPPGINTEIFRPLQERSSFSDPYILCVGRLSDPRKNIGLLLEAYARLPKKITTTTALCLAGSSRPPENFWSRAHELGVIQNIRFIEKPSMQELVRLYQNATVFSLPSDEEGLGIVILEAMSCGVPVVSTMSGGPDGIITDGHDGFLVPLDDATAMSKRLETILLDQCLNRNMGAQARLTAQDRYDEVVTGNKFLDIWEMLSS
jgi:D-inositol-3-phosphate glycosyltransferase